MYRRQWRMHSAFTLIELLVVIAIIALLVSILVPSLTAARLLALRANCKANLHAINTAFAFYTQDSGEVYPCDTDPVSTSPMYWLWMGRGWRWKVGPYLGGVTRTDPSVLFCKGDKAVTYESTSYAYSMSFYHSPRQIDAMTSVADTYSNARPSVAQRTDWVSRPSGKIMVGEWTSNHPQVPKDSGWWTWAGRRTYLTADGAIHDLDSTSVLPAHDNLPDPNLTIGGITGRDIAN
ncbi:MAG: type II secretion system protein [Phycisphaerae bacterium]